MLEQPHLLLRPWQPDGARGRRLDILGPQGEPVGLARSPPRGRWSWLRWWDRPVVTVHESEDEPLLCTLSQGFGRRWSVHDADGQEVGRLAGPFLINASNQQVAVQRRSGPCSRYLDSRRRELARAEADGGVRLMFGEEGPGNPFVRMLLLAAALVHHAADLLGG
jgi:hypothetical protein